MDMSIGIGFARREIEFYRLREYRGDRLHIFEQTLDVQFGPFRCPTYCIRYRRDGVDYYPMHMLMSPVELATYQEAVEAATGRVGTTGFGLGYVALRMAQKPEVTEVVVVEREPEAQGILEALRRFHPRLTEKITLRISPLEEYKDPEPFDFFWLDHFPTAPRKNELWEDFGTLYANCRVKRGGFWRFPSVLALAGPLARNIPNLEEERRWAKRVASLRVLPLLDEYHPVEAFEIAKMVGEGNVK